ncbi:MAG: isoleucine--tRNA ligase [Lentisphaeria bacterium]|nr:isoleucine--tRNA ligase [Lentisphaeria bacterium]
MAFKNISNQVDFPAVEEEVLQFWKENNTFEKSMEQRKDGEEFVFYDGPPFATGLPHYGHLLAGTIKDVVPRYQTMRGKYVERRFGWDTHGLPIEALAQDALGISGTYEIKKFGIDKFNEQCRSMVLRYVDDWRRTVTRMGRWVDFDNDYKTMEPRFMETIWWIFKKLWEQNRVYKSYRIMPYSWKLSTPLSNFEAGSNYKDVQDPAVTVRTPVLTGSDPAWGKTYLLIWTTTPWTLPENLAICAGADIDYVVVRDLSDSEKACYVMAEARVSALFKKEEDFEIVARMKGSALKDWTYEPLFPYFAEYSKEGAFRVLNDDYVSTGDGVGLVHQAPAYGEDDFRVCKEAGINVIVDPLDASCNFTDKIPEYAGRFCKDCDKDIIKRLKEEGKLVHQATITHSYPFCDRTDTPLIYRAIEAWYVKVEDLHERLAKNNSIVRWQPDYVGTKRFGNWLLNARDWNISRNRFWGSCIPVWINDEDPEDRICVGSVAELEELSGEKVTDLHKHFVDKIVIRKDGKTYHRTPEVLDCWFESGAMPYAQQHYPFENKERFEKNFPADFIAEGLDQTRGWFYTLLVLGTCLFDQSPYRNVVVNGLILAEDGKKMSKRLKNYPDPLEVVNRCGADALRLFMLGSQVVRAEDLRFSEAGVREVLREVMIPMWNALSFFTTYANVDGYTPAKGEVKPPVNPSNVLDRWILSSASQMVEEIRHEMDEYNLQKAATRFTRFIDDLTNWYIRRSRRRFWKSTSDSDKQEAYATLHYVLILFAKTAAPFIPLTTEAIYRALRTEEMPESVHLCDYPTPDDCRDEYLEKQMELTMCAVTQGRFLRTANNLKVRQPLARAIIALPDAAAREMVEKTAWIIADELNVKKVDFCDDEEQLIKRSCKANFKALGARLGKEMKVAAARIAQLTGAEIGDILNGKALELQLADGRVEKITADDLVINREERPGLVASSENGVTIALETALTPELEAEGMARELVSKIQNLRKELKFDVTDRIEVVYKTDEATAAMLEQFHDYITGEVLAVKFAAGEGETELDVNGKTVAVNVSKTAN